MKKQFMLMFGAFAALSLASCTNDKLDVTNGNRPSDAEGEGFGYISLSINADMTRAEDTTIGDDVFNAGDENEYALTATQNTHIAFFFDEQGAYFGNSYLQIRGTGVNDESGDHTGGEGHDKNVDPDNKYSTTEKLYTYITKDPRVSKDGVNPTSVMVLLNCAPYRVENILDELTAAANALTEAGLRQYLVEKIREENNNPIYSQAIYVDGSETYFTMTNSAYVDDNGLIVATPISGKVYPSREEALKDPVTIFVERIVAKHSVEFYNKYNGETSRGDSFTFNDETNAAQKAKPEDYFFKPSDANGNTKVTLDYIAKYNGEGEVKPEQVEWNAHILNWGANALETNTYLYKNLALPGSDKPAFTGDWWKAYGFHRSYWAIDEHHNNTNDYLITGTTHEYPTQYTPTYGENAKVDGFTKETIFPDDNNSNAYTENNANRTREAKKQWSLVYRSYNEVGSRTSHVYTLENTFGYEAALKGYAPLRYGTHIIVAAQLIIPSVDKTDNNATYNMDDKGFISNIATKVSAEGYFWSETAYINYAAKTLADYITNGVGHTFKSIFDNTEIKQYPAVYKEADFSGAGIDNYSTNALYIKDNNTYKKIVYTETAGTNEVLASEVFRLDETYLENGDGKRALKENQPVYYYRYTKNTGADGTVNADANFKEYNSDGDWYKINEKEFASYINGLLPAGAKYYNEGRMYYPIAIKHIDNGTLRNNEITKEGTYDEGDFGVVRNHWYRLNVLTISKPGTPVEDPEDPIIPNDPEENDYMGVEIVILPWHVISQDVYL